MSTLTKVDVAIVGMGAMGSAAFYHLAQRGMSVLGIEQFELGHGRGSSHGETRVIRTAYHEHPDYVPLLQRAIPLWKDLEREAEEDLYAPVGCLEVGPPDGEVIQGVLESAQTHGLSVEQLSAAQVEERFDGFRVPDGMTGTFETQGGVLRVEDCIRAHGRLGQRHGGALWSQTRVSHVRESSHGVTVQTDRGSVEAGAVLVSPGAWAADFFPQWSRPLEIRRKPLLWFAAKSGAYSRDSGSPVFLYQVPEGLIYGFPAMEDGVVKVALHSGGESYDRPEDLVREIQESDTDVLREFVRKWMPLVDAETVIRGDVCMYTCLLYTSPSPRD